VGTLVVPTEMSEPISRAPRVLFRAPDVLFRPGLGGLVPKRFLYLEHRGRRSGERRDTVLEVADRDRGRLQQTVHLDGEEFYLARHFEKRFGVIVGSA
jgi:hypothetical protein